MLAARIALMANRRLSKDKQALVLAALCEGMAIEAVARMFKTGTNTITRIIRETGEAFADYMDRNFRDLSCLRIEFDEQWQYVGCHKGRMTEAKEGVAISGYGQPSTRTRRLFSPIASESAIG
jgi:hypothetical protein